MKKESTTIKLIFCLIIFTFILSTISALSTTNLENQITDVVKTANDVPKTTEQIKSEYLNQQWISYLNNTSYGPAIISINKLSIFLLGEGFVPPTINFIFTLCLVVLLVIIIYKPLREIMNKKIIIPLLSSLIIVELIIQQGTLKKLVNYFVPLIKNPWVGVIALILAVILVKIYNLIVKKISKKIKKDAEKNEEESLKRKEKASRKIADIKYKGQGI